MNCIVRFYAYVANDPTDKTDPSGMTDNPCASATSGGSCPPPLETVVATGHRDPPSHPPAPPGHRNSRPDGSAPDTKSAADPNRMGRCDANLVAIGNEWERISEGAGDASALIEGTGAVIATGGYVAKNPAAIEVGGGFMVVGGSLGYIAGGAQTIGGLYQGFGGAGWSNAWNGGVTTATGLAIGQFGRLAKYDNTVFGRKLNSFIDKSTILGGGVYDALVQADKMLGPQQKSCQ